MNAKRDDILKHFVWWLNVLNSIFDRPRTKTFNFKFLLNGYRKVLMPCNEQFASGVLSNRIAFTGFASAPTILAATFLMDSEFANFLIVALRLSRCRTPAALLFLSRCRKASITEINLEIFHFSDACAQNRESIYSDFVRKFNFGLHPTILSRIMFVTKSATKSAALLTLWTLQPSYLMLDSGVRPIRY